jgi:endonuclease G
MRWPLLIFCTCTVLALSIHASSYSMEVNWEPKGSCDQRLQKKTYGLCYSSIHRQSLWAYHKLNTDLMSGKTKRTNDYRRDPFVIKNPVTKYDYSRTGFDRGHLVPAADMKKNKEIMSETFFMTNMAPQRPGLNRGIWSSLENLTRKLVKKYGEAVVLTLPVIKSTDPKLPKGITIPSSFAKIIFWPSKRMVLAFQIPNSSQPELRPEDFQVTVNSLESQTGLDFFWQLPDSIEETLEDTITSI